MPRRLAKSHSTPPIANGTKRLTISIPDALYSEVERIAERDSRSLGWVIRQAIENRVKEESPLLFNQPKS